MPKYKQEYAFDCKMNKVPFDWKTTFVHVLLLYGEKNMGYESDEDIIRHN